MMSQTSDQTERAPLSPAIIGLLGLAVLLGAAVVWLRIRAEQRPPEPVAVTVIAEEKHAVTPEMAAASAAMATLQAPSFRRPATDGSEKDLAALLASSPVLLTFIKDGCPCSEAAQPFFNRLHAAYGERCAFLGVIDREAEAGIAWARKFRAAYPLMLDPALDLVRAYEIENSAYVVLIDTDGRIRKMWPGYSVGMLNEVGAMLAELAGTEPQKLEVADAPDDLYSGCPYDR
jgi:peroxiredoxin